MICNWYSQNISFVTFAQSLKDDDCANNVIYLHNQDQLIKSMFLNHFQNNSIVNEAIRAIFNFFFFKKNLAAQKKAKQAKSN